MYLRRGILKNITEEYCWTEWVCNFIEWYMVTNYRGPSNFHTDGTPGRAGQAWESRNGRYICNILLKNNDFGPSHLILGN